MFSKDSGISLSTFGASQTLLVWFVMASQIDLVTVIHAHQAGVWRYLRVLGCDASQADDLTQETFLAVLEKPFLDYGPKATAAYLRKVARNLFVSSLRRNSRSISVETIDQVDEEWTRWAGHDSGEAYLEALQGCLGSLTERARRGLELRYRDELTRSGIATELELTEDGAKNLLQRAKQQLRECLQRKLD